jgi:hypothetical protein
LAHPMPAKSSRVAQQDAQLSGQGEATRCPPASHSAEQSGRNAARGAVVSVRDSPTL